MHKGKYECRHGKTGAASSRERRSGSSRLFVTALAVMLVLALTVGGSFAWINYKDAPVQNKFSSGKVTCEVTEDFDDTNGVKTNVNVKNTGNIDAYIRVKLVTYRTNNAGRHIGGTAYLPAFTVGSGWREYNGYYYYTKPVAPENCPAANLADYIQLAASYADTDGGKQALDVIAEAIQSLPEAAVKTAWGEGFSIGADGTLIVPDI